MLARLTDSLRPFWFRVGTIEGTVGDEVLVRFGEVVVQMPAEMLVPAGEWKAPPEAGLQPTIAGFNGGGLRLQSTAMKPDIQFIVGLSFIYLSSKSSGHPRADRIKNILKAALYFVHVFVHDWPFLTKKKAPSIKCLIFLVGDTGIEPVTSRV